MLTNQNMAIWNSEVMSDMFYVYKICTYKMNKVKQNKNSLLIDIYALVKYAIWVLIETIC